MQEEGKGMGEGSQAGSSVQSGSSVARGLKSKHVQFIALGGCIGTGLFLGSGQSISLTGPSIVLVYALVGLVMFVVMRAIGETLYRDPSQTSFLASVDRHLGVSWGHFAGWTYWLIVLVTGMAQLTAIAQYFVDFFGLLGYNLAGWSWAIELAFIVLIVALNLTSVGVFGEAEYWLSMIKIALIAAVICTGVVMVAIGFSYPAQSIRSASGALTAVPAGKASLSNLFAGFSLAPNGWMQFFMSFQMVFFAYNLIESIGMTAAETENPRAVLPKAVNRVMAKVIFLYVGALLAVMAIVPWRAFKRGADGSFTSPFIMVFQYAGLSWASMLTMFVVVMAAASALTSMVYSTSRQLRALALESHHDSIIPLAKVSKKMVPVNAAVISGALIYIPQLLQYVPGMDSLFVVFTSLASALMVFVYILTLVAHQAYRRSADFLPDGFVLRGYKIWDPLAIAFFVVIYATLFIGPATRIPAVLGLVWLVGFGWYSRHVAHTRAAHQVALAAAIAAQRELTAAERRNRPNKDKLA